MTISIQHLSFGYGKPLFADLSLELPSDGTILFTGASGRGKTTLLRLIAGLEQPQSGTIHGLEGKLFSWVFQQDRLLPWATVWGNAALAGKKEQAKNNLEALGLGEVLHAHPSALSGGMARRLAIARALTYGGDVALLDEAFNGLDLPNKKIAAALLDERFPLKILSSHNQEDIFLFANPTIVSLDETNNAPVR